jgi:enoyl-CoA hydratase/carnithine racemase
MAILIEDIGRVRLLTLNRPDALNAFNGALFDALTDALIAADADEGVGVVVLTGAGRAFSAGADLADDRNAAPTTHGFAGFLEHTIDFSKPLILAVNGLGVGIGATLCGLADLVFMSTEARLRCPFSRLGLVPEAGSTLLFPELMGRQAANWVLMSSEWLSAQQCKELGLAFALCSPADLLTTALSRAGQLAALPAESLRETKRLMLAPRREALLATFRAENAALAALRGGPANLEAIAAFREKREPDFSRIG